MAAKHSFDSFLIEVESKEEFSQKEKHNEKGFFIG